MVTRLFGVQWKGICRGLRGFLPSSPGGITGGLRMALFGVFFLGEVGVFARRSFLGEPWESFVSSPSSGFFDGLFCKALLLLPEAFPPGWSFGWGAEHGKVIQSQQSCDNERIKLHTFVEHCGKTDALLVCLDIQSFCVYYVAQCSHGTMIRFPHHLRADLTVGFLVPSS